MQPRKLRDFLGLFLLLNGGEVERRQVVAAGVPRPGRYLLGALHHRRHDVLQAGRAAHLHILDLLINVFFWGQKLWAKILQLSEMSLLLGTCFLVVCYVSRGCAGIGFKGEFHQSSHQGIVKPKMQPDLTWNQRKTEETKSKLGACLHGGVELVLEDLEGLLSAGLAVASEAEERGAADADGGSPNGQCLEHIGAPLDTPIDVHLHHPPFTLLQSVIFYSC